MDLLSAKIVAMVLMGSLALFFGLLPLKVKLMILKGEANSRKRKKRERLISGLLCFGSGVLLATVFIHMIPETREGFQRLQKMSASAQSNHSHDNHSHSFLAQSNNSSLNKEHSSHDHSHNHDHHEGEDETNHDENYHNPSHNHDNHNHQNESHIHFNISTENNIISKNNFNANGNYSNHDHNHEHMNHDDIPKTNNSQDNHSHYHDHSPNDDHDDSHDLDGHATELEGRNQDYEHIPDHDHNINHNVNHEVGVDINNHDHETNHSFSHDHDHENFHRASKDNTSHNQILNTSNFHNSEPEDVFNEPDNSSITDHSILGKTNHTNEHHHREDGVNLNTSGNINLENDYPSSTDHNENKSEAHDHFDRSHFEHDDHENKNLTGHTHDDHARETLYPEINSSNQKNVDQSNRSQESVTEHLHNDLIDINDVIEKTTKKEKKILQKELINNKGDPIDNENKANIPKFEAFKQGNNSQTSGEDQASQGHDNHAHQGHDHDHEHEESHGYPMAELVICVGFLTIYFIEEIVHKLLLKHSRHHHHHHHGHHHHHHHHHSPSEDENSIEVGSVHNNISSIQGYENGSVKDKETNINGVPLNYNNNHKRNEKANRAPRLATEGIDNPAFAGDVDATSWNPGLRNSVMMESSNQVVPTRVVNGNGVVIGNGVAQPVQPSENVHQGAPTKVSMKGIGEHVLNNIRSLLVVIALSFHSIFEGLAVGLQEVQKDVWYLFLAISAHKFVIAFCIGLEFLEAGTPLVLYLLYMVGLALITPIGVGIGIIVTENQSFGGVEHYYVITVLQGLAGGTLLYVALLEVLERERSKPGGRFIKLLCLALGFGAMASLEAIGGGHSHGPSGTGGEP